MKMIAEGIPAARSARQLALKYSVDAPILEAVYQVLYEGKAPYNALWELLGRRQRHESDSTVQPHSPKS